MRWCVVVSGHSLHYVKTWRHTQNQKHNALHCRQRRTEPRPQVTCTENLVKFGRVVFETWANEQTGVLKYPADTLTATDTLTAIFRTPTGDEVTRCRPNGTQPYLPAEQCRPLDRPRDRPARSVTDDDDRHQPAKQYWPIKRASNN